MELVVMELFLLVVVVSIAVIHMRSSSRVERQDEVIVAGVYITYLLLAVISHVHMFGLFPLPFFVARSVIILHILSVPLFVFIWMNSIERRLLPKGIYRVLFRIQSTLLVLFFAASLFDIAWGRLYVFSQDLLLTGGYGVLLMFALSICFVLVEFCTALVRWKFIKWHERVIMVLTAVFLLFSLVLFEVFRQPYMFSLSSAFMLILSFFSWQRKELLIDSPTEREERNQHDGSSPERVQGKQGEIPRPLGRKRRQRLLSPGLALGY
jgi:hypothetical protein